ncbi:MAG: flagellar export protein FliJ [Desulfobulbaceae bacterium]|nr:flagellar export protein FliJ [Desulfobulbaceae bacterium]
MKRPKKWGMEPVLKYRKQIERVAQHEYFKCLEQEEILKEQLLKLTKDNDHLFAAIEKIRTAGTAIDQIQLYENRIFFLKTQLEQVTKGLEKQKTKTNLYRKKLLRASQKKKVLDQLKDRQNKAYQKFLSAKETKILDEIAVLFHKR